MMTGSFRSNFSVQTLRSMFSARDQLQPGSAGISEISYHQMSQRQSTQKIKTVFNIGDLRSNGPVSELSRAFIRFYVCLSVEQNRIIV